MKNIRFLSTQIKRNYKYFENVEIKKGVALIKLNGPNKMNVLNKPMLQEAKHLFEENIFDNKNIKAIVFSSSKSNNFIAGADIDMLAQAKDKNEVKSITQAGNGFFNKVKKTGVPLVSAINGSCMGGGLEWALYCDYRIATPDKKTILSLPEVKLGLMPGMAGTYHLPKLIGLPTALEIILTGKNIKPSKALKIGLINEIVDSDDLEERAIEAALQLSKNKDIIKPRNKSFMENFISFSYFRNYVFNQAKNTVDKKTKGKMPAPYKIINTIKDNYNKNIDDYLKAETNSFADLSQTSEAKALIGIFQGMSKLKSHNYGESNNVRKLLVVGSGLMGSGISQVSLKPGNLDVTIQDNNTNNLSKCKNLINSDNIKFENTLTNVFNNNNPDIVIEAAFENLKVKKEIISSLENHLDDKAIIASNTSAIPISDLAKNTKHPERIIGMHYFSPVPKMPLIEIIPHSKTNDKVIATALDTGVKQGKVPIVVKDVPGFFVNRCLAPLLVEFPRLILEGVDPERIDKLMLEFGMPVGPLTLCDEVGIDIAQSVSKLMSESDIKNRMNGDYTLLESLVNNNELGKKTKKGFYVYQDKNKYLNPDLKKFKKDNDLSDYQIQMRIMGRFINEVGYCLQNKIIKSPVDGDIGTVLGIGFPPHLGGPFRMLDSMGISKYNNDMLEISNKFGEEYKPPQIYLDYQKNNKLFH
jgi:enoyl-CoA hydratase/long-chain 3-hydroxyacyl-CoA dehydrogenase